MVGLEPTTLRYQVEIQLVLLRLGSHSSGNQLGLLAERQLPYYEEYL